MQPFEKTIKQRERTATYRKPNNNSNLYNQYNFKQRFTNKRISRKISQLGKKAVISNSSVYNSLNNVSDNVGGPATLMH